MHGDLSQDAYVGNRLKRVLTKFEADRSHVRGVNERSKFDVASANVTRVMN